MEFFYPGIETLGVSAFDSTVIFYSYIDRLCPPNSVLLDYGAGRGEAFDRQSGLHHARSWISRVDKRIGCDVDPVVQKNLSLDESYLLSPDNDYRIPIDDNSVDCAVSDWVVEHLPDPAAAFSELHRVIRPGGYLCVRTSNYLHYSFLLANLIDDTAIERWAIKISQPGRQERDVFPKYYRANRTGKLAAAMRAGGFQSSRAFTVDPESAYMSFSTASVVAGGIYHRLALAGLLPRATLLGFAKKGDS